MQRVFSAYKLLGKADRMVERLTPFFVDTVEAHAAKIVKTHVLLSEQVYLSLLSLSLIIIIITNYINNITAIIIAILPYFSYYINSFTQTHTFIY